MGRWYPHVRVDQEYYWPRCAALVRQSDLASFSRGRGFVLVGTFEPLGANNNNVRACVRNREEELVWLHSLILSILDCTCVFALGSTVSCSLNTQEVDYKTVGCAVKCCSSQFPVCCRHYTSSYSCSQLHLCRGHSQTEKALRCRDSATLCWHQFCTDNNHCHHSENKIHGYMLSALPLLINPTP